MPCYQQKHRPGPVGPPCEDTPGRTPGIEVNGRWAPVCLCTCLYIANVVGVRRAAFSTVPIGNQILPITRQGLPAMAGMSGRAGLTVRGLRGAPRPGAGWELPAGPVRRYGIAGLRGSSVSAMAVAAVRRRITAMTVAMIHRSALAGRCPVPGACERQACGERGGDRWGAPAGPLGERVVSADDGPAGVARARAKPRVEIQVAREAACSRGAAAAGGMRGAGPRLRPGRCRWPRRRRRALARRRLARSAQ